MSHSPRVKHEVVQASTSLARSATLSPSRERPRLKRRTRRDNLIGLQSSRSSGGGSRREITPRRRRLRKTNSEPEALEEPLNDNMPPLALDQAEQIQAILNTFNFAKYTQLDANTSSWSQNQWNHSRSAAGERESPDTDDTELAVEYSRPATFQLDMPTTAPLQPGALQDSLVVEDTVSAAASNGSNAGRRASGGITTRLGAHPRGVIQFLPSLRQRQDSLSHSVVDASSIRYDTYSASKAARAAAVSHQVDSIARRRTSADGLELTERFASFDARPLIRMSSQSETTPTDTLTSATLHSATPSVDSLAGFTRFGRLLRQLRQLPSPEPPELPSDTSTTSTPPTLLSPLLARQSHSAMNALQASPNPSDRLNAAEAYMWKRRSSTSLRRSEDMRAFVVREMVDIEEGYVRNLQLMVDKYMRPLKKPELCALVEPALVDEIFFQIPEILAHHEIFLAAMKARLEKWDERQKIGDLLSDHLTKQSLFDAYTAFINNWQSAKQALRQAMNNKSGLVKYLERCSREHRNKLTLDALLIMPVQRIPRYELLVKELLKHTPVEHSDYPLLVRAQREIHELATKIDAVEQQQGASEQMLQRLRELEAIIDGLDDLVVDKRQLHRYDVVSVVTSNGRKERCLFLLSDLLLITSVKRKSNMRSSGFLESNKFKLLMKVALDDLEVAQNTLPLVMKVQEEIKLLQEDLKVLNAIHKLAADLKNEHEAIDTAICSCAEGIRQQLSVKNEQMKVDASLTSVELQIVTQDGVETMMVTFTAADQRAAWETAYRTARETLAQSLVARPPPVLLKSLPLQRTRAGLHFSCAGSAKDRQLAPTLWIGNNDGYVGQLAVISSLPDADVQCCAGVGNARVTAVCAVPPPRQQTPRRHLPSNALNQHTMPGLESDSATSEDELNEHEVDVVSTTASIESVSQSVRATLSTVWLGTEEGALLIYGDGDRRHRQRMQLHGAVTALLYVEDRVYVGLHVGQVLVYERKNEEGLAAWDIGWRIDTPRAITFREPIYSPIGALCATNSSVWVAAANQVLVTKEQRHETTITVSADGAARISQLIACGFGIWLALHGSSVVKLLHASTKEVLLEVNVRGTVTKALQGYEDVIRQHKLACLRVTSITTCKHLLWIGTSAGVLLSLTIPHLTHATTRITTMPPLNIVPFGHAGPCRFVLSVDAVAPTPDPASQNGRRLSLHIAVPNKMFVISGGDGYEDFGTLSKDDIRGANDSANHLLIWSM